MPGALPRRYKEQNSHVSPGKISAGRDVCYRAEPQGRMPGSLPRRYKEQVCLVLLLLAVADHACSIVAMRAGNGNVGKRLTNPAVCVCATLLASSVEGGADFVNCVGVGS